MAESKQQIINRQKDEISSLKSQIIFLENRINEIVYKINKAIKESLEGESNEHNRH